MEFRVAGGQEPVLVLLDVFEHVFGGLAVLPVVEMHHGLVEASDLRVRLGAEFVAELPVGADPGVHVFPAGVIVVPGQPLGEGLLLDPGQDVRLVFGPVGVDGLLVFGPELGQGVAVLVCGASVKSHDMG